MSDDNIQFFNAVDGRIDTAEGVVRGVSLITMGSARGHNLEVDEKTLTQLKESLENTPPPGIKAKLNHRSGVEAVAMTRAPSARPSAIAAEPVPPDPPSTRSHSPASRRARCTSPTHAVCAGIANAAASGPSSET